MYSAQQPKSRRIKEVSFCLHQKSRLIALDNPQRLEQTDFL
jgi:hypothetical protein